ncbi:extracellular solute-binding protein [Paenibacillus koleovorans]|uniref:extracellular solute-binding protein n=1 Tax=Paenibacillus koleovorans TaxID=121608 RepID=UPI0013E2C34C|nr:extracellular solute-binding protein [Paenibacillus koleovorans]
MKAKRSAAVLLTAALTLGGLVACSNGDKKGEGSAATVTPAKGPVSFTMVMNGRGQYIETMKNINDDPYVKKLEELTNVDLNLELILEKDYQQKMTLKMSSADIPDVVKTLTNSIYGKELAGGVQAGVFMPLDDLLQKYGQNLLKKIPKEAWDRVKYNGKIMGIPAYNAYPNTLATYVRKDMMDKAGIKQAPKTVDEFLTMLRAFKKNGV